MSGSGGQRSAPGSRGPEWFAYRALMDERPEWFRTPPGGVEVLTDPADIAEAEARIGARYAARGQPEHWARVGLHYADPYLMVLRDAVRFPDGSLGIHHRTLRRGRDPSGVCILPLVAGQVLLLRHFRHPTRQWHWEFPRGAIEPGASPEETVATELREEIEGNVVSVRHLGRMYGATGFMGLGVLLYAAELDGYGQPAKGEGIVGARLVSPAVFDAMIKDGEVTDSFTLGCWLQARLQGLV